MDKHESSFFLTLEELKKRLIINQHEPNKTKSNDIEKKIVGGKPHWVRAPNSEHQIQSPEL